MNEFLSAGVWAALQVSIFCVVVGAFVFCLRRWIGAAVSDLLAISMGLILVVSVASLVDVSSWMPDSSAVSQSRTTEIDEPRVSSAPIQAAEANENDFVVATGVSTESSISSDNDQSVTIGDQFAAIWDQLANTEVAFVPPEVAPVEIAPVAGIVGAKRPSWLVLIGWGMFGMVVLGIVRLLLGLVAIFRLLRSCKPVTDEPLLALFEELRTKCDVKKQVALLSSSELKSPATVGWLRAKVLVPTNWNDRSEAEVVSALSHELIHVRNSDFLKNLISQTAIALNFFNPLVHWLGRELRISQEFVADHFAASISGGTEVYLTTIAELALNQDTNQLGRLAQPFLPTRKTFIRRIEMLKASRPFRVVRSQKLKWCSRLALASLAIFCISLPVPNSRPLVAQEKVAQENQLLKSSPAKAAEIANSRPAATPLKQKPAKVASPRQVPFKYYGSQPSAHTQSQPSSPVPSALVSNAFRTQQKPNPLVNTRDAYVSKRTKFFLAADLEQLEKIASFRELIESLQGGDASIEFLGLDGAQALTLQFYGLGERAGEPSGGLVVHYRQTLDPMSILNGASGQFKYHGIQCYRRGELAIALVNEFRTLLVGLGRNDLETMLDATGSRGQYTSTDWQAYCMHNRGRGISVAASKTGMEYLREVVGSGIFDETPIASYASLFAPIYQETEFAVLNFIAKEQEVFVNLNMRAQNEEAAQRVRETAIAFKVVMANLLNKNQESLAMNLEQALSLPKKQSKELVGTLSESFGNLQINESKQPSGLLSLSSSVPLGFEQIGALFSGMLKKIGQRKRMVVSLNNLRQLQLAMHNYESVHQKWPQASKVKNGHPYSWRIELLPFLGQSRIYNQYRFEEPWDSEHNQKVTSKMPGIFRHPEDKPDSTSSGYFVITGEQTIFPDGKPTSIGEMADGTSNTGMIFESKRDVHWAKPEDIPYQKGKMKSELGGFYEGLVHLAFGDGSVRMLNLDTLDPKMLEQIVLPHDGMVLAPGGFDSRVQPPAGRQLPAKAVRPNRTVQPSQGIQPPVVQFQTQGNFKYPPQKAEAIPQTQTTSDSALKDSKKEGKDKE